jgi:hypothetical protein
MQEEVSTKIVAVAIRGSKLTGEMLNKALQKFIKDLEKAEKTAAQPKTYCGKQTVKQLVSQNAAISNIEVTDGNIKSFDHTAKKYGIDYALKKDTSEQPPRYIVFFKGRDVDVMTQAFKEFSAKDKGRVALSVFLRWVLTGFACYSSKSYSCVSPLDKHPFKIQRTFFCQKCGICMKKDAHF